MVGAGGSYLAESTWRKTRRKRRARRGKSGGMATRSKPQPGDRVLALRSADCVTRIAYVYGEGVFVGYKRPPEGTVHPWGTIDSETPADYTNPCIELDGGGMVWGFQCWWGAPEAVRSQLDGYTFEQVNVAELENPALS